MFLVRVTYRPQFFSILTPAIQVVEQCAHSIAPKRHAALLSPFAKDNQRPLAPIEIRQPQVAQFPNTNAGVPQHPQDGAVASRVAVCDEALLLRSSTRGKQFLKLLKLDDTDHRFFKLGQFHTLRRILFDVLLGNQPVANTQSHPS